MLSRYTLESDAFIKLRVHHVVQQMYRIYNETSQIDKQMPFFFQDGIATRKASQSLTILKKKLSDFAWGGDYPHITSPKQTLC